MYEIPLRPLSDCGKIITGKTPSSKVDGAFGTGTIFVTPRDLDSRKYVTSTERELSSIGVDSVKKNVVPANSVLVSCIGSDMGKVALIKSDAVTNQQINTIVVDVENHNPEYVYYALLPLKNELKNAAGGTTMPILNKTDFGKFEIPLPELEVQNEIVRIITCIDSKISNNTIMNATLEKIAQRIFKSWFVDFDPVKANAEGVPFDGLSPEIQALFPNEFEESELGMIPKGWEVKKSNQLFDVAIGKTPPRKEPQWFSKSKKDITWISIKDMGTDGVYNLSSSEYLTPEAVDKFNVKLIPENTVILSFKLTVGRLAITIEESTTNEAIAHFKHSDKSYLSSEFLYSYLKVFNFDQLGSTSSIATAVNSKIIKDLNIIEPSKEVSKAYDLIINPLFIKIKNNQQMTDSLIKIRDKLLPRLISGKITIQKAEELLEEAS